MLNFAKSLMSSSKSVDKMQVSLEDLSCDFFVLEGDRWTSLSDGKCTIVFQTTGKNGPSFTISCDKESVSDTFNLDSVSNLARFTDEDGNQCFQWISRKGKGGDNMDEFGIRFETEQQANRFASLVVDNSQQTATVLIDIGEGVALLEQSPDGDWGVIDVDVRVLLSKTKKGEEFLSIQAKDGSNLFHSLISASLQLGFDLKSGTITFLGLTSLIEDLRVLGIKVADPTSLATLRTALGLTVEPKRRVAPRVVIAAESSSSSSEEDQSDVEMWEDVDQYRAVPVQSRRMKPPGRKSINKFLETGRLDESKAFVFSLLDDKSKVGFQVYDSTKGDRMEMVSTTTKIDGLRDPSALMLHEGDRKCLLLDPTMGRDKVFELDLERGKVVNEWTPATGSITALVPLSKESQRTDEKVFLGINDKSIFAIDPRMQPKEHVGNRAYSFTYASNVKLSSAATDRNGHIVAANKIGELRLFDGEINRDGDLKKAKSLLSGFGDPVTHVEISSNGEYILATTTNYLTLTRTLSSDGSVSGFNKSLKSISGDEGPIVLSLTPSDVAKYKLKTINFTPARFDESRNLILTSTGSLAVVFDMKRLPTYSIKPMHDYIIDLEKQHGASGKVVAMFEDRVELARVSQKR